jgi:hypothetical protein
MTTWLANKARASQPTDADSLANLPSRNALANCVDLPNHLVSWHTRVSDSWELAVNRSGIRMTHATSFDSNADFARRWFGDRSFNEFQLAGFRGLDGAIGT